MNFEQQVLNVVQASTDQNTKAESASKEIWGNAITKVLGSLSPTLLDAIKKRVLRELASGTNPMDLIKGIGTLLGSTSKNDEKSQKKSESNSNILGELAQQALFGGSNNKSGGNDIASLLTSVLGTSSKQGSSSGFDAGSLIQGFLGGANKQTSSSENKTAELTQNSESENKPKSTNENNAQNVIKGFLASEGGKKVLQNILGGSSNTVNANSNTSQNQVSSNVNQTSSNDGKNLNSNIADIVGRLLTGTKSDQKQQQVSDDTLEKLFKQIF